MLHDAVENMDTAPEGGKSARQIIEERREYLRLHNEELQPLFAEVRAAANRRGMVTVRASIGKVHLRGE